VKNIDIKVQGTKVIITMDVGPAAIAAAEPSSTGKTKLVASTQGATPIDFKGAKLTVAVNLMAK
jgi:hypothetical protein